MKVFNPAYSVVMQEVPGEISVAWMIATCRQGCVGCSYKGLEKYGSFDLTLSKFEEILKANQGLATCVLFMGGEEEHDLSEFLSIAKNYGYKTCLYTGLGSLEGLTPNVLGKLDYCKTGRWEGKPITDPTSNQKFWDVKQKKDISDIFRRRKAI